MDHDLTQVLYPSACHRTVLLIFGTLIPKENVRPNNSDLPWQVYAALTRMRKKKVLLPENRAGIRGGNNQLQQQGLQALQVKE